MIPSTKILASSAAAIFFASSAGMAVAADTDAGFYKGKTLSMVIPIGPGGAYDVFGRTAAKYMGRHIPGNPTITPRNMPGGGGMIASNWLYNVAPQDGTTLNIIWSAFVIDQLRGALNVKYDARKLTAIGRFTDTTSTLFVWHKSPVNDVKDFFGRGVILAGSSRTGTTELRYLALNRFLGTKFKVINGYKSARDYVLASERGEVDGGTSTYAGLLQNFPAYVQEGKLKILLQFSGDRAANMPNVPTMVELAKDPKMETLFRYMVSNNDVGRSLYSTPNVPPERVRLLRNAFMGLMNDEEFKASLAKQKLTLNPLSGDELEKRVLQTFNISKDALAEVNNLATK